MNGYERVMTTLNGGQADQVPVMLHSFMSATAEAGLTMEQYRSDACTMANTHIRFAEKYDLDGLFLDVDTCLEAYAIGVPTDFPKDEPARVTAKLSSDMNVLKAAMRPERLESDPRIGIALEAVRIMKKAVGNDLVVRGNCDQMAFSLAMLSYGMADFLADLLDEELEEDVLDLIDRAYAVHLRFHKLMKQAGADITSFGDSSCGPELISRDMYLKFSFPFQKKLADQLRKDGILTVCHICGNLDNILKDVVNSGFPAIEVDYKTNMVRAQSIMSGKAVMSGSIDPSGVFYFGTPDTVRKETQELLETFRGRGMIACSGCALASGTPGANIRTFVDTVRAYQL